MIGINNRDLEDFTVDIQRTFDLLADVPAGKIVVSESGIHDREQIEELEQVGVDAVLIGETLDARAGPRGRRARADRSEEPTRPETSRAGAATASPTMVRHGDAPGARPARR